MNIKAILSVIMLVVGVLILSGLVSIILAIFGPSQKPTTVIIERPAWNNYRGWWGYPGAGLPGWGGPKYPPMPAPHPKPPMPPGPGGKPPGSGGPPPHA